MKTFEEFILEQAPIISTNAKTDLKHDIGMNMGAVAYSIFSNKFDDVVDLLNQGKKKEAISFIRQQMPQCKQEVAAELIQYRAITTDEYNKIVA